MCLEYKPAVVACFCIYLACKWANWEIPLSRDKKPWFWYIDSSVTQELLEQLITEFLDVLDNCSPSVKNSVMEFSTSRSHLPALEPSCLFPRVNLQQSDVPSFQAQPMESLPHMSKNLDPVPSSSSKTVVDKQQEKTVVSSGPSVLRQPQPHQRQRHQPQPHQQQPASSGSSVLRQPQPHQRQPANYGSSVLHQPQSHQRQPHQPQPHQQQPASSGSSVLHHPQSHQRQPASSGSSVLSQPQPHQRQPASSGSSVLSQPQSHQRQPHQPQPHHRQPASSGSSVLSQPQPHQRQPASSGSSVLSKPQSHQRQPHQPQPHQRQPASSGSSVLSQPQPHQRQPASSGSSVLSQPQPHQRQPASSGSSVLSQPQPHQLEPYQPQPHQPQPHQPQPHQQQPASSGSSVLSQPQPHQPKPPQRQPHQPQPHQLEPYLPQPHQPQPHQPKPPQRQPHQLEPPRYTEKPEHTEAASKYKHSNVDVKPGNSSLCPKSGPCAYVSQKNPLPSNQLFSVVLSDNKGLPTKSVPKVQPKEQTSLKKLPSDKNLENDKKIFQIPKFKMVSVLKPSKLKSAVKSDQACQLVSCPESPSTKPVSSLPSSSQLSDTKPIPTSKYPRSKNKGNGICGNALSDKIPKSVESSQEIKPDSKTCIEVLMTKGSKRISHHLTSGIKKNEEIVHSSTAKLKTDKNKDSKSHKSNDKEETKQNKGELNKTEKIPKPKKSVDKSKDKQTKALPVKSNGTCSEYVTDKPTTSGVVKVKNMKTKVQTPSQITTVDTVPTTSVETRKRDRVLSKKSPPRVPSKVRREQLQQSGYYDNVFEVNNSQPQMLSFHQQPPPGMLCPPNYQHHQPVFTPQHLSPYMTTMYNSYVTPQPNFVHIDMLYPPPPPLPIGPPPVTPPPPPFPPTE